MRGSEFLKGLPVVVLMGGPGAERAISLRSGEAVTGALESLGARVRALAVEGPDFLLPPGTKLVFNMIHGTFGEDGQLQELLEAAGVPYTGEGAAASRAAFDKIVTKKKFEAGGVPTARWEVVPAGGIPQRPPPFVVKPPRQGSSVGVRIVRRPEEAARALAEAAQLDSEILVEELFEGRELTVGLLGGATLPAVEIRPKEGFYDYRNKYTPGATRYEVPARLAPHEEAAVAAAALAAWQALGLEVYGRADLLLAPDGSLHVMEINTIPGMTETSLLPKAAAAAGFSFAGLCAEIARLSLRRFPGWEGLG